MWVTVDSFAMIFVLLRLLSIRVEKIALDPVQIPES